MKTIIVLADGMSDYPIEKLGGKTPLMAARTPAIDRLCAQSRCGMLVTVPADMAPGSEVANLAVLGYDARKVYQGRGVLEAASMGVELAGNDLAMRCNIICIEDNKIKNHSAGHISSEESLQLVATLNERLAAPRVRFHPGVSYRHLLVIKDGKNDFSCTPPHDVPGTPFRDVMPRPRGEKSVTAELVCSEVASGRTTSNPKATNAAISSPPLTRPQAEQRRKVGIMPSW